MSRYLLQRHPLTPPFMADWAREVDQLQDSIQRMFDSPLGFQPTSIPRLQAVAWVPPFEIHETDQNIIMTVELPGLEKEDLAIDIDDDVFTLRGEKHAEHLEGDEKKENRRPRQKGIVVEPPAARPGEERPQKVQDKEEEPQPEEVPLDAGHRRLSLKRVV